MSEKLQKVLARVGFGSRREIETWITQGRIKVNGVNATLGDRVTELDKIFVDGQPVNITPQQSIRVIAYHKPEGEVCTRSDPEGRPTVFEKLPKLRSQRWIAIGRLDINTSGLMLFTTHGELAHHLMHPSFNIKREYAVRVMGQADQEMLRRLKSGVNLDDGPAHFDEIVDAGGSGVNHWYHVVLNEGRNREVRRLWESQGMVVSRLMRIKFGPIALRKGLRQGQYEQLSKEDIKLLMDIVGMKIPAAPEQKTKPKPKRVIWKDKGGREKVRGQRRKVKNS